MSQASRAGLALACAWLAVVLPSAGCGGGSVDSAGEDARTALRCRGVGEPTVVLESGLGVTSWSTWVEVVPALARKTRVCLHDRPGTGAAPPKPGPRTSAVMVRELRSLLKGAGEKGPFVLVGASLGGLNAQLYAASHPDEVAGLVYVDAIHPDWDRRFREVLGPRAARTRAHVLADNPEGVRFKDLLASDAQVRHAGPVPPVPRVVLVHGTSFDPGGTPIPSVERAWRELAAELAGPGGEITVVPDTTHRIAEDDPAAVIRAVRDVLAQLS